MSPLNEIVRRPGTGTISEATITKIKLVTGANKKINEELDGRLTSFNKSFKKSQKGCHTGGPILPCILALDFLRTPAIMKETTKEYRKAIMS